MQQKHHHNTSANKEDNELVQKAQHNTKEYERLYAKYTTRVYTYIWKRVGKSKELAEDLTQETFLRAFRSLSTFRNRGYSYLTYLLRIAHNLLVNQYRKKKSGLLSKSLQEAFEESKQVEEKFDRDLEREILDEAIGMLPKHEQDVIIQYYRQDKSIKEIAQAAGKSENAIKLLLARAKKRLAGYFKTIQHL